MCRDKERLAVLNPCVQQPLNCSACVKQADADFYGAMRNNWAIIACLSYPAGTAEQGLPAEVEGVGAGTATASPQVS